ncbi:tyrosine/phenylalanine carboxypeptidase domain-containing protein [Ammonicoccus fulvus]|uniref:Tyrosine/phenylalanine carboxypeptidase domain-containing protein n=1 Tax=Ammonicoccus fulvus TaxID=3138240 RepID=A0ABZ3FV70_9ACTN
MTDEHPTGPEPEAAETEALGLGTLSASDLAADHLMASLAAQVRFLLEVTPVDADSVRQSFLDHPESDPVFTYRELDVHPDVLEAQLAAMPLDSIEDATVGTLLRARYREMRMRVEMLRARDTKDFLTLSIEQYGGVMPRLREVAVDLLDRLPGGALDPETVDADEFLEYANAELEHYREIDPDIGVHAEIRDDVTGVLVDGDTLMISTNASIARSRVNALIQHEVGTHLVTQVNGVAQPLKMMGSGLARYDETQEGLAVLAEIGSGGLTPSRLRQLAARVIAVDSLIHGASFVETHRLLVDAGLPPKGAWTTTMRVYRAGGFTKDAAYLRGLLDLFDHLRSGGSLDLFFLGKFSLEDLHLVADLHARRLLRPARITPRWLSEPEARTRLDNAVASTDLLTLISA